MHAILIAITTSVQKFLMFPNLKFLNHAYFYVKHVTINLKLA